MTDRKTLLLIAGMHRSGTSVLTRVLNLLGAELGGDLLGAQAGVNERGFWEHRRVVEINEQLLQALERSWYDFRPLPEQWRQRPAVQKLGEQAAAFLDRELGDARLAAIKDPRICLLFPFWADASERAGFSPGVILTTRAPWEVAASLCRRDPLDTTTAMLLWLRYTEDAEIHSRELPRVVMDYHQLLDDWPQVIARIGQRLDLDWPIPPEEARPAIDRAIDPSLQHQRSSFSEKNLELASLAGKIHHQLTRGTPDTRALDALWKRFDELMQRCEIMASALASGTERLFSINEEHQELGREHARALATIRERDRQLKERTREWEQLGRELEYCMSVVEERDGQLEAANRAFHALETQYQDLEERYRELAQNHQQLLAHPLVRISRKLFLRKKP